MEFPLRHSDLAHAILVTTSDMQFRTILSRFILLLARALPPHHIHRWTAGDVSIQPQASVTEGGVEGRPTLARFQREQKLSGRDEGEMKRC